MLQKTQSYSIYHNNFMCILSKLILEQVKNVSTQNIFFLILFIYIDCNRNKVYADLWVYLPLGLRLGFM